LILSKKSKLLNFRKNIMSNKSKSIHNQIIITMKKRAKYFLISILFLLYGCKSLEISSYWRDHEIKIDGNSDDWQGRTWVIKDLPNVAVGFINDDKSLYLSLTVGNRSLQRQVAFGGLTIWFDRNAGDEKKFGVHYPLPIMMRDMPMERRRSSRDQGREHDTSWTFPEQFSDELDIFGPMAGEHHRMRMQETGGIEAALHFSQGLLIYEMKVPLTDTGPQPYVIGSTAGSIIGVGIETGNGNVEGNREGKPMFGDGERGGGFGGRRGRMSGGAPPGGMRENRESLKLWAKVQLAKSDSSSVK
jgi:hypothetical protein